MKLNELQISHTSDELYEDYGNLKAIERKFHDAIKIPHQIYVPADTEYGSVQVTRLKTIKSLGQNSKIEKVPFKAPAAPVKALEFEAGKVGALGFVVAVAGSNEQIAIVMPYVEDKEKKFIVGFDTNSITKEFGDTAENLIQDIADHFGEKQRSGGGPRGRSTSTLVPAKLYPLTVLRNLSSAKQVNFTTMLSKAAKAVGLTLELLVIYPDTEARKTAVDRSNARYGSIPRPHEAAKMDKWMKSAAQSLQVRLDNYKTSKAVGIDSVEELVDAIREKGYLEKIKIGRFSFNQTSNNIRLEWLLKPSRDICYVEYRRQDDGNPAYDGYLDKRKELMTEFKGRNTEPEFRQRYEALKATIPPSTIKVILKLDKGAIVPDKVQSDTDFY